MDSRNYGYAPTPYRVLSKLSKSNLIATSDTVIDYGCGKGRAAFYLSDKTGCKAIGIDYNQGMVDAALANAKNFKHKDSVNFFQCKAEEFKLTNETCFYFFNPFSITILDKVIQNIAESLKSNPRNAKLFFYGPTEEHYRYFRNNKNLSFVTSIDCTDSKHRDPNLHVILVYDFSV